MASFFLPLHIPSFPLNILLLNQHPPNQWTLFLHLGYKVIKLFITGMIITHSFQPERRPTVGNSERTVTNSIGTVRYNTKVCALRR
jgi:hypothetical protein